MFFSTFAMKPPEIPTSKRSSILLAGSITRPPLRRISYLTDLFFFQAEKQNSQNIFLEWLHPINKKKFTWSETVSSIYKLSKTLKKYVKTGDRILLISENRPEWLITDMAIMLSKAITVPAYTCLLYTSPSPRDRG